MLAPGPLDPRKVLSSAINASTEGLMLKNLAAPYEFLGGTGRKKAGKSRQNRPKPVKEGETPWRSVGMLMKIRESRKSEVATLKSIH